MLSPKMQRGVRVNENQILMLAERAQYDHSMNGYLHKKSADSNKWQLRWFILYQNLLFYYDNETSSKPSGLIFLEGCYCERIVSAPSCLHSSASSSPLGGGSSKPTKEEKLLHCFAISYRRREKAKDQDREKIRQYELRAASESECVAWIGAIREASFNKLLLQKEELEQKHVHLLQVVESEKTAKWQYTQQCEELASDIKKLRAEICSLRKECRSSFSATPVGRGSFSAGCDGNDVHSSMTGLCAQVEDSVELRKIKKVQSFFRGWLCRRRWKQIVEEYIKSPHAESMRKRNHLVFAMIEEEQEYVQQLEVLVSCFLRPFKMAACAKNPPLKHEDVNSIFLNTETVLFLHQIFFKGLTSRLENWPTLVLGDLFDMLLPMLSIYQEYVRNHHFSLQTLTECKGNPPFANLLKRLEAKPACQGRSLETFLTYPMHQIPRYIIKLAELLAHTPHDHVERKTLASARQKLEDLSRQMHDEVSETENLRRNLAIERMIMEGCDILLDVNQVYVRQGSLVQIPPGKGRLRSRLGSFKGERDAVRQCFLFSNHLILTRRIGGTGRLHLIPDVGKIPLIDVTLIEDPSDSEREDDDTEPHSPKSSQRSSYLNVNDALYSNRDFKLLIDDLANGTRRCVHLIAPTPQEKQAWISDISQCIENIHLHKAITSPISSSGTAIDQSDLEADPRLFEDDVDIRFSRNKLNSCKLPQVRYASPAKLLQRLTDLRFLSLDFLNTFLLTYRVFTDGETVLNALKKVFYETTLENVPEYLDIPSYCNGRFTPRRTSGASSVSGYFSESIFERDRSLSGDSVGLRLKTHRFLQQQSTQDEGLNWMPNASPIIIQDNTESTSISVVTSSDNVLNTQDEGYLAIPASTMAPSSSSDTIIDGILSGPSSPSNLSSHTLVGSTGSGQDITPTEISKPFNYGKAPTSPLPARKNLKREKLSESEVCQSEMSTIGNESQMKSTITDQHQTPQVVQGSTVLPTVTTTLFGGDGMNSKDGIENKSSSINQPSISIGPATTVTSCNTSGDTNQATQPVTSTSTSISPPQLSLLTDRRPSVGTNIIPHAALYQHRLSLQYNNSEGTGYKGPERPNARSFHRTPKTPDKPRNSICSLLQKENLRRRCSESDDDMGSSIYTTPRGSLGGASLGTISSRASIQHDHPIIHCSSKVGVVITSARQSQRRSSTSTAAAAFAIATSASSNPRDEPPEVEEARNRKESVVSSPATMRVLNVLRHWVSKHFQDFEQDAALRSQTLKFLDDITRSPNLLPSEHRAAAQLMRLLTRDDWDSGRNHLETLLKPPTTASKETIESLSALEIAEQMTYLDHQIFLAIRSEEFLSQAWMKSDKRSRAEHIILMTKRFNDGSRLVASEIISRSNMSARVAAIEKWTAVADICRCLHNYNGVLQICAALSNAAVYRLKKTWDKVPKTIKQTHDRLQAIVSSDGRFRGLRDALHRCDPPCIPYLGMYLTDLNFLEEGLSDLTPEGLLNFSKMRMVGNVIREIRHFQQTPYKIEHVPKVTAYLLDTSLLLDDDELYRKSLEIEPRPSRLSAPNTQLV